MTLARDILSPSQRAAHPDGSIHRDLHGWLLRQGELLRSLIPPGLVIGVELTPAEQTANFTSGVGKANGPYAGWLISDGTNDTTDLTPYFLGLGLVPLVRGV